MDHNITNFDELIDFIETNNLTSEQIEVLMQQTLGVHSILYRPREEKIEHLKAYWERFKDVSPRPTLLDTKSESGFKLSDLYFHKE
jgi:thermostable 8-oxoguanine DNA glycosylase